jgi:hypothetical protein
MKSIWNGEQIGLSVIKLHIQRMVDLLHITAHHQRIYLA